ncbi:polyhydroxybutyrate depolymerase [Sulfitobacter marinus]|uniref:Polyhydroxybutyrate depolymerase n=1 Tax=Sulfitobacter marinus TaxID=394264 RepID=A0A1I6U1N6_9RHOB|nr:polyhydroxybutyrate depolymerase [Sulfitobacter marinus]SFS95304.1 polyhydroxybutyrate depolymerase [Sulfitobacter marinus]
MKLIRWLLCVLLVLPAFASATSAQPCGGDIPCKIGNREYNILLPDDWDGTSPLPVMMHFHAFLRRGKTVVNHPRIGVETKPRGVMLIAPSAQNRAWRFWQDDPADIDFADAVLADVAARYPVDPDHIYISGFSFGAAMAWRYACARGDRIAGLMTMSGTIKQASACPNPPDQVRHVHGLNDIWMSLPRGPGHDATNAVALWRKAFGCAQGKITQHWLIRADTEATNIVWDRCSQGRKVTLDVHTGGHFIPEHWLGTQLDDLMARE